MGEKARGAARARTVDSVGGAKEGGAKEGRAGRKLIGAGGGGACVELRSLDTEPVGGAGSLR